MYAFTSAITPLVAVGVASAAPEVSATIVGPLLPHTPAHRHSNLLHALSALVHVHVFVRCKKRWQHQGEAGG